MKICKALKGILLLLLLSYGLLSLFCSIVNPLRSLNLYQIISNGKIGIFIAIGLLYPVIFILASYFIRYPFTVKVKIYFLVQSFVIIINLIIVYFAIGVYHDHFSYFLHDVNSFYPWVTAYRWLVFLFALWSLALAFPALNKFKFFNWPFERDKNASKDWIPLRER